jgi:hypothetical protein
MSRLLFALAGPIVWLLLFSALYAIETMACTPAVGLGGTGYGTMAGAAIIATGLLLAAVAARQFVSWRHDRDAIAKIGMLLTVLAIVASAWTAIPLWLMQRCG